MIIAYSGTFSSRFLLFAPSVILQKPPYSKRKVKITSFTEGGGFAVGKDGGSDRRPLRQMPCICHLSQRERQG